MLGKRLFDVVLSALGLVLLSPLLLLLALLVWMEDGGFPLFKQIRIGRGGQPFRLLKLRSMRSQGNGRQITAGGDPRCTRIGRILRRFKLDELPQLWNVLRGDMSLVGPRPEVPLYVDPSAPEWQTVLRVRPGITDLASLIYRNEEELLAQAGDPEHYYRRQILPDKLALNALYLRRQSPLTDLRLILWTLRYSLLPAGFEPGRFRQMFS